jgi:hypothetical protein
MRVAPPLLIVEHPRARVDPSIIQTLEAQTGCARVWVLREEGRDELDAPTLFHRGMDDVAALDALPEREGEIEVALVGFGEHEPLPLAWLPHLAALNVRSIQRLSSDGVLVDHCPRQGATSGVLSVFPGPIVPTVMGSHQRAFGVLEALARNGINCDVLLTCARPAAAARARTILSQLCPGVYVNGPSGRKLPVHLIARQGIEKAVRRSLRVKSAAPRLFEERLHTAAAFSGRVQLRRLLESGRYHTVIVNYAWMEPIRALLPKPLIDAHRWICDTHDVQFIRTRTHNVGEVRFAVFEDREQRLELDVLRGFDHVLAISPSDAEVLRDYLPAERVLEVPTGFDYARQDPRAPNPKHLVFGFIGGRMDANVKALKHLLEAWWPSVIRRWPEARLRIAGEIASVPEISDAAFLCRGVEMVGYVNSLRGFYRSIDGLLSPVLVRGGLNFKAVESLMAGRLLVTTELGALCLGDPTLATIARSGEEVVARIEEELASLASYKARRTEVAARTRSRFGDETAYSELIRSFDGHDEHQVARPIKAGPLRVLIQVGDHYENWARTVRLGMDIRARGHHPIALVYGEQGHNYFLAHGIDAVSLYPFSEPKPARRVRNVVYRARPTAIPKFYRLFDLDDLAAAQSAAKTWTSKDTVAFRENAIGHVKRCEQLLNAVAPDVLLVWNGYTGITANLLRQSASIRGLGVAFLERSALSDAAFVDRLGTNGYSSICRRSMEEILAADTVGGGESLLRESLPPCPPPKVEELRRVGAWRSADRIVFVPLQVEADTNLRLHSPDIHSMAELVQRVWDDHHDESTAIVVRPHPEERDSIDLPELPGVYVDDRGDLHTWLELADLVITVNSTVGLTALLRGRSVAALGRSIYSGKGLTDGAPPVRAHVDAYARYLIDFHTSCGRGLPRDLEPLLPARDGRETWCSVSREGLDVIDWWKRWREFAARVGERARSRGTLTIETDLRSGDTVDLTYRELKAKVTRDWLERRAREVFELDRSVVIEGVHQKTLPRDAVSSVDRIVVRRAPRAAEGYVLDRYLAPWAPTDE